MSPSSNGFALTATAEADLARILSYIAKQDSLDRALHMHSRFTQAFEALAAMPAIGFKRPHLTGPRLRWHLVFRFLLIYDPESSPIMILRVLHGMRDLDRILRPGS
ncbi:MAG: type II toxin-antitoxin system RelE/ParE family toxin [Planctomycetota bacterium]